MTRYPGRCRKPRRTLRFHEREATSAAKQVWCALFPGEAFTLKVYFARIGYGRVGDYSELRGVVRLNLTLLRRASYANDVIPTLVHEFNHHRNKALRHGDEFDQMVVDQCARIGVDARIETARIIGRAHAREAKKERRAARRAERS